MLSVRGHGVGCAGDAEFLGSDHLKHVCMPFTTQCVGIPLAVATDNAVKEVHGELGKLAGRFSEQLIVPNSPQLNQVKSGMCWDLEYLCSVH